MEKQRWYKGNTLIHISGLSWSFFIVLIALQTILGRSMFEISFTMVVASALFIICIIILTLVILTAMKKKSISPDISQ